MFICNDCESVFETPKVIVERHPYGDGFAGEEWGACPHCRSTEISEAKKCSHCGEWVAETNSDGLCDICEDDLNG
jgi:rubrerythrin